MSALITVLQLFSCFCALNTEIMTINSVIFMSFGVSVNCFY
jgi:hypothetical protein